MGPTLVPVMLNLWYRAGVQWETCALVMRVLHRVQGVLLWVFTGSSSQSFLFPAEPCSPRAVYKDQRSCQRSRHSRCSRD